MAKKKPVSGFTSIILGFVLLFLVKYMNSNHIYTKAPEHWLNAVRYLGLFFMLLGFGLIILYEARASKRLSSKS